eukprot:CAMPEP_0174851398 /NCGR_PEP_ID=MMETSP1114-20130205/23172_1 /TAXON_ID=312471 /ORGANISM="Neobodo designis, Strain CCAP 1951/1" /LENGTH=104 /DNA_ID=CAMNT_0016085933 /DNA_START=1 /DNA_END=315 /DNA_ORIENTATION=-
MPGQFVVAQQPPQYQAQEHPQFVPLATGSPAPMSGSVPGQMQPLGGIPISSAPAQPSSTHSAPPLFVASEGLNSDAPHSNTAAGPAFVPFEQGNVAVQGGNFRM